MMYVSLIFLMMISLNQACKKSDSKKEDPQTNTPPTTGTLALPGELDESGNLIDGVTLFEGDAPDTVVVTGQLALDTGSSLFEEAAKVLAFPLRNGSLTSYGSYENVKNIMTFDVDPENNVFKAEIPNEQGMMVKVKVALNEDAKAKRDVILEFPADMQQYFGNMSDDELNTIWPKVIEYLESGDRTTWVLIGMTPSGNKLAEADTFRYFGFPSGDYNFMNFPPDKAKGHLSLGRIENSDDDGRGKLAATNAAFNFSDEALFQMAYTNSALKSIKNGYVNVDLDKKSAYTSQLWFWFNDDFTSISGGEWSSVQNMAYQGFSAVLQPADNAVLSADSFCGSTPTNILEMAPPAGTTVTTSEFGMTIEDVPGKRLGNSTASAKETRPMGELTEESCYGPNSQVYLSTFKNTATGVFDHSIWQFGGRSGFSGTVPKGWWTLYKNNEAAGHFEFASAYPLDEQEKPKVYIPRIKLIIDEKKQLTNVEVRFSLWDPVKKEFVDITDLSALKRVVDSVRFSARDERSGHDNLSDLRLTSKGELTEIADPIEAATFVPDLKSLKDGTFPTGWYMEGDEVTTEHLVNSAFIWYDSYGNQYAMGWRKPETHPIKKH